MFLNLDGLVLLFVCLCLAPSVAAVNWNSSSSIFSCASHAPFQLEYGTSTRDTYSTTTVIVTIQDLPPTTSLPAIVSVEETSVSNGDTYNGLTTLQTQSSPGSSGVVAYTTGTSTGSEGGGSSHSAVSMVSPTNAYMVLSEALETESSELATTSVAGVSVSDDAQSITAFDTRFSSEADLTTLPPPPSSFATTPSQATEGASFTLDGVSYTAFRPAGVSSPNLVLQGGQTTTTINPAQPATLPVNNLVSLDQNGNPVAAGSTVYLSTQPESLAPVLQSSTNSSTPAATGYPTPSYGVWGNGIPSTTSTSAGSTGARWDCSLQIALAWATMLALLIAR